MMRHIARVVALVLAGTECSIARTTPRGLRVWRIKHGLTAHLEVAGSTRLVSVEELVALAGVLVAALVLSPSPWTIVGVWIAGLVLHVWLHRHDRCAGGCGNSPAEGCDEARGQQ
jgi:type IV secretory pathway TrbD component